ALFQAGLAAVDAGEALRRHVHFEGGVLRAGGNAYSLGGGSTFVVGGGKAAAPMAAALEGLLGDRVSRGLVVVKDRHTVPTRKIEVREAGHPVPDARGEAAAREVLAIAQSAGSDDLLIVLLSGGASALLALPAGGVTLEEKRAVTNHLLRAGAPIQDLNSVRKHLSAIKGGRLAQAAAPARVLALILSDVVGDPLDVIASGPTAADPSTYDEALSLLSRYDPEGRLPRGPRAYLEAGAAGRHPETPKPGDRDLDGVQNFIVGSNRDALEAVEAAARVRGYEAWIRNGALEGEARDTAAVLAREVRDVSQGRPSGAEPLGFILGGETTVTVRGNGRGGRNTEFALAFALGIEGLPGAVGLFAGTDGTDGATDAAGAIVTGETAARARRLGVDPRAFLDENDSYSFFERAGGLLVTGPTMTNVMDLAIILLG
ncbi:MAG: glycerate kinase, partial [Deltaproteobacteria bacterium]|nr:glycerate kinase [Deltaproteobacteria bacterium]